MRRLALAALVFCPLSLVFGTGNASAYTPDDTEAAIAGLASSYGSTVAAHVHRIVDCETGHTMQADLVGDHGTSFGPAQLHRGGLLAKFYAEGYSDPFSPWQSLEFMARAIVGEWAGLGIGAWSWTCS